MKTDLRWKVKHAVNGGQLMRLRMQILQALDERAGAIECLEDIIDQGRTGEDAFIMAELANETLGVGR